MNTITMSRTEVELQHHRDMMNSYSHLFNKLPRRMAKRRAECQERFNFHFARMNDLYKIKKLSLAKNSKA
jgi:hypothetical protein